MWKNLTEISVRIGHAGAAQHVLYGFAAPDALGQPRAGGEQHLGDGRIVAVRSPRRASS
jgi:hypothetical protein